MQLKKIMKFNYPSDNSTIGELLFDDKAKYDTTIEIISFTPNELFEIVGERKISLFKCDIEGAEYALLDSIIKNSSRLTGIVIELHNLTSNINAVNIANFL